MSDFINKIRDEAKAVSAAIDQELTVLEGVDGYDALRDDEASADNDNVTAGGNGDSDDDSDDGSDDTEGGGTPTK